MLMRASQAYRPKPRPRPAIAVLLLIVCAIVAAIIYVPTPIKIALVFISVALCLAGIWATLIELRRMIAAIEQVCQMRRFKNPGERLREIKPEREK